MNSVLLPGLALLAAPIVAGNADEQVFKGPARYCGEQFATDLLPDEQVAVRHGPDFVTEALVSPRGGFGIYEGFAPQDGTGDKKVEAGLGAPTFRLNKRDGAFGYVVWTGDEGHPFYLHVWGLAFRGDDRDFALLRRLQFGAAAKRGCLKPTFG